MPETTDAETKEPISSLIRRTIPEVAAFLLAALVLLSARSSLADHYKVPTGSMEPTVLPGDYIFVAKSAYGLRLPFTDRELMDRGSPQPGHVVVLDSPVDGTTLLKRVIATEGQTVKISRGRVLINGTMQPVHEEHDQMMEQLGEVLHPIEMRNGGGPDFGPKTIPEGKLLVMGDHRGNSLDGRIFGLVDEVAVRGKAKAVYLRDWDLGWRPL
ncbi:MAG: signal peptidase I [Deltaproteobacteria bacterium]|nr:signal peptidase I [Deltaproteobacteria bacterium]